MEVDRELDVVAYILSLCKLKVLCFNWKQNVWRLSFMLMVDGFQIRSLFEWNGNLFDLGLWYQCLQLALLLIPIIIDKILQSISFIKRSSRKVFLTWTTTMAYELYFWISFHVYVVVVAFVYWLPLVSSRPLLKNIFFLIFIVPYVGPNFQSTNNIGYLYFSCGFFETHFGWRPFFFKTFFLFTLQLLEAKQKV